MATYASAIIVFAALLGDVIKCSTVVIDGGSGTSSGNPVIVGNEFRQYGLPMLHANAMSQRGGCVYQIWLCWISSSYQSAAVISMR